MLNGGLRKSNIQEAHSNSNTNFKKSQTICQIMRQTATSMILRAHFTNRTLLITYPLHSCLSSVATLLHGQNTLVNKSFVDRTLQAVISSQNIRHQTSFASLRHLLLSESCPQTVYARFRSLKYLVLVLFHRATSGSSCPNRTHQRHLF